MDETYFYVGKRVEEINFYEEYSETFVTLNFIVFNC